ncbi:flagellar hook-length control protein FliK [Massilia soli]|uniref:Flagellar hook-length control protein FliK n=1 Tax=Massilia soli TaxID=2792854 RepID=A0ABS7SST9_9BURK|nr:flagellar hook-length control protein FliK [Massilia soli]MBZ2209028.1 flagellar hook-length control protein FliK [Massilia soli]
MQTQNLLPQISSAAPAPARQNTPAPGQSDKGAAQFSQALSREINQRQNAAPAPAQARPAAQSRPAEKAAAPKQDPGRPAQADSPRQADAKADSQDKTATAAPAGKKTADSVDDADARPAELPVTDMLALVASFNQLQGVAKDVPVTPVAAGGAAGAQAPGLGADGSAALPLDLAGQFAQGAVQALGEQPAADGAASTPRQRADATSAATATVAAAAAAVQPEAEAGATAFAGLLAQERAEPAALKDTAAAVSPLSSPIQQASLNIAQAAAGVAGDRIAARVGTPAWDNQVSQKIVWMVAGQEQSATLTLNPPDMGPMQVVLSVTNDQATVTFSANQLEVRQALENAMPKLREMMSESGIALGNATVDAGTPDQRQAPGDQPGRPGGRAGAGGTPVDVAEHQPGRPMRSGGLPGMVDTFA